MPASSSSKFPMDADRMLGDGGNVTVYERPDGSRYTLDKRGHGCECQGDLPIFGRARFDARELSTGRWDGSLSALQTPPATGVPLGEWHRARGAMGALRT